MFWKNKKSIQLGEYADEVINNVIYALPDINKNNIKSVINKLIGNNFDWSSYYNNNDYLTPKERYFRKITPPGRNKLRCEACVNGDRYSRPDCSFTDCKHN